MLKVRHKKKEIFVVVVVDFREKDEREKILSNEFSNFIFFAKIFFLFLKIKSIANVLFNSHAYV